MLPRNARFRYVYDMFCEWEHEIRVEERLAAAPGKRYPQCVGGAGACPPEDCGGPDAYHARREEATGLDAMNDLAVVADTPRLGQRRDALVDGGCGHVLADICAVRERIPLVIASTKPLVPISRARLVGVLDCAAAH